MSNVLVVGFGNMGRNHARVVRDLGHDVRTLDPRLDSGADYGVLSVDLVEWTDVACIAVPIDQLAGQADAWINRGKDVLVEKPGATDLATLAYLHQRAVEQDVKFAVGYTERHNGAVHALVEAMPKIGGIRQINIRRLGYADSALDPALNLACHDLDVLDFLGYRCKVHYAARMGGHLHACLEAQGAPVYGSKASFPLISIEASHLHPDKVRTLEVVGTEGVLELDYRWRRLTIVKNDDTGLHGGDLYVDKEEPLVAEWRSFLKSGTGSTGTAALALAEDMARWPEHVNGVRLAA